MKQHRLTGSTRHISTSLYRKKPDMEEGSINRSSNQAPKRGYSKIFETKKAPFKT